MNIKNFKPSVQILFNNYLKVLILFPVFYIMGCFFYPDKVLIPSNFKRHFVFPVNSYWIYKNQLGEFDTVILQNIDSSFEEYHHDETRMELETFVLKYRESYYSLNFKADLIAEFFNYATFSDEKLFFLKLISDSSRSNYSDLKHEYVSDYIDTLKVQNVIYKDILKVRVASGAYDTINEKQAKSVCFVKDIGLVKRDLNDGTVWELVDYKINK
jgi:hypothetical protein